MAGWYIRNTHPGRSTPLGALPRSLLHPVEAGLLAENDHALELDILRPSRLKCGRLSHAVANAGAKLGPDALSDVVLSERGTDAGADARFSEGGAPAPLGP
jgi:hypothetical protein